MEIFCFQRFIETTNFLKQKTQVCSAQLKFKISYVLANSIVFARTQIE